MCLLTSHGSVLISDACAAPEARATGSAGLLLSGGETLRWARMFSISISEIMSRAQKDMQLATLTTHPGEVAVLTMSICDKLTWDKNLVCSDMHRPSSCERVPWYLGRNRANPLAEDPTGLLVVAVIVCLPCFLGTRANCHMFSQDKGDMRSNECCP